MLKKEPAVLISSLAAIVQAAVIWITDDPGASTPEFIVPILTVLAGLLVRKKVASEETINKAGFTMGQLVKRANNPSIPRATEKEE